MSRFEKISSILGFLGFFLALAAFALGVRGHLRTNDIHAERLAFDMKQRESKVVIQIGRDLYQKEITFIPHESPFEYSSIYNQKYNLIINNIGLQTASITDWRVVSKSLRKSPNTGEYMYGFYRGMNPKIRTKDGALVTFPLSIEPNKPIKLILELGVRVSSVAWNSVQEKLTMETAYNYHEAEKTFSDRGYPQFGEYQLNDTSHYGDMTITSYGQGRFEQKFILYLTKGNGIQVKSYFFSNISDIFIQGENGSTSWKDTSVVK